MAASRSPARRPDSRQLHYKGCRSNLSCKKAGSFGASCCPRQRHLGDPHVVLVVPVAAPVPVRVGAKPAQRAAQVNGSLVYPVHRTGCCASELTPRLQIQVEYPTEPLRLGKMPHGRFSPAPASGRSRVARMSTAWQSSSNDRSPAVRSAKRPAAVDPELKLRCSDTSPKSDRSTAGYVTTPSSGLVPRLSRSERAFRSHSRQSIKCFSATCMSSVELGLEAGSASHPGTST